MEYLCHAGLDPASRNSNTLKKHWIPGQARNDKNRKNGNLSSLGTIFDTVITSICVKNSPTPEQTNDCVLSVNGE